MNKLYAHIHHMIESIMTDEDTKATEDFHSYLQEKMQNVLHDFQTVSTVPPKDKPELFIPDVADSFLEKTFSELAEGMKEFYRTIREQTADEVRAELTDQWVKERDILAAEVDKKVTEMLTNEMKELRNDIEMFHDLEAEYAQQLKDVKAAMSDELKGDLMELVEQIDAFLEQRLTIEFDELRDDIEALRTVSDERDIEMKRILAPLSGRQYEVMEAILRTVPTELLEAGYKKFIGRVIKESNITKKD